VARGAWCVVCDELMGARCAKTICIDNEVTVFKMHMQSYNICSFIYS